MTINLVIKGKVQGVFYRASAKDTAERLQITGWVKNTVEGNVEITASGNDAAIDAFIEWCKQGPPRAIVKEVILSNTGEEYFEGFEVIR
ncbi:MAG TPA: acylphosphatase [Chitinophagaceae bacterium]|nr:acylphosphatase [Chitinophagaceae bacterium]